MRQTAVEAGPEAVSLKAASYELSALAEALASEARRLGQLGQAAKPDPQLMAEIDALIRSLRGGTRTLRLARLNGVALRQVV